MPVIYRIHPAIGIARVGDSPRDFFIGPEAPGITPAPKAIDGPAGQKAHYKDAQHRIKRQGARFRIYEYTEDAKGVVTKVREITGADADIEWEVHLANRKAAGPLLEGTGRRNAKEQENKLIIDAGPQRISGASQKMQELRGTFMGSIDVKLGDLAHRRLRPLDRARRSRQVAVASRERAGTFRRQRWLVRRFGRRAGARDRAVEGRQQGHSRRPRLGGRRTAGLRASRSRTSSRSTTPSTTSWRPSTPGLAVDDTSPVSFTNDIYPILRRVSLMHWVSEAAAGPHGPGDRAHFMSRLAALASKAKDHEAARKRIFLRLRRPDGGGGDMPKLPKLAVQEAPGASITRTRSKRMERWAQGTFDADWPGPEPAPTPLDKLPEQDRPHALDRAALEACVGGPYFPGIEVSRVVLEKTTFDAKRPFRINTKLPPGALTERMAVPWQADFNDCTIEEGADWWPGQRPNQVRRGQEQHAEWTPKWDFGDMVAKWAQLGFVVARKVGDNVEYVEDERFLDPPAPTP